MYLKEFEHNIYMLKKLNKINNFSSKFLILNFPNKLENLTTLKNIKTESDLLLYSINNVNNIINHLIVGMDANNLREIDVYRFMTYTCRSSIYNINMQSLQLRYLSV